MADTDDAQKPNDGATVNWADKIKTDIQNAAAVETDDDDKEDKKPVVPADGDGAEGDEDADADDEGDNDDSGEGDDKDADDSKDDTKSVFHFTQFKGDGKPETYLKNLEEGYDNSSKEAVKLKHSAEEAGAERDGYKAQVEAIKTAVSADPEFGKKVIALLDEASANDKTNPDAKTDPSSNSPFLKDAENKWRQENDQEAEKFAAINPEVLTDPILADKVKVLMERFGKDIYKEEGRLAKAGELMEKAYGYLGLTAKKQQKQDLTDAMKKDAAPTRKQAPKKKAVSTAQFSNLSLSMASKMGITKERLEKNGV